MLPASGPRGSAVGSVVRRSCSHDTSLVFPYRTPMGFPWDYSALMERASMTSHRFFCFCFCESMGLPWVFHGAPMGDRDSSVGVPRNIRGASMGLPWHLSASRGLPLYLVPHYPFMVLLWDKPQHYNVFGISYVRTRNIAHINKSKTKSLSW